MCVMRSVLQYTFPVERNEKLTHSMKIYAKQIPFADTEDFGIFQAIMSGQHPATPQEAPDGMQLLMEKCWAAEPGSRPEVAVILEELNHIKMRIRIENQDLTRR